MSIKMICSDIDGTLLQYGRQKLEGEILTRSAPLHDRGILFCPASGRQYTSLRLLFAPVADCCVFLCENGGVLFKDEQCIAENPMPRALAEKSPTTCGTAATARARSCSRELRLSMERGLGMLDRIQFIGNRYKGHHPTRPRFPERRSSRCRSTCMRAWKSTWTALCRAGSRPTAPWRARTGSTRPPPTRVSASSPALPRAGLRP